MKKWQRIRREDAIKRFEAQLEDGTKTKKKSTKKVPLTDSDKKRISKQIESTKANL